jgi:anti-sigma B factor antagonist
MDISHQMLEADMALICLDGRLDAATAGAVKAALGELIEQGCSKVIVDLAAVRFIDSSGLAALVSGLRLVREHGGHLVLSGVQPQAKTVFRLTMLDRVFSIYSNPNEAQQNLR